MWTSVLFCYVYGDYFELYVPEKVNDLLTGENILDSPTKLLVASLVLAIPAVMIALSIPRVNRFLNVFFGILFTLMMLLIGVNSLTPWYSFYAFLAFLESFITASIVLFAWKWNSSFLISRNAI